MGIPNRADLRYLRMRHASQTSREDLSLMPHPRFLTRSRIRSRSPRFGRCFRCEALEDRSLLATIPVFSTGVTGLGALANPGALEAHFQLVSAPYSAPQ